MKFIFHQKQKKRFLKNLISRLNANVVNSIAQVFFPAMMIYFWGIEVFGIWMFLISIPYSLSIINADISTPITNKMSYFYNKKDKKEIDKIYSNFTIITLINIFIISVIFIFIYFTIDINLKILENLSLNEIKKCNYII